MDLFSQFSIDFSIALRAVFASLPSPTQSAIINPSLKHRRFVGLHTPFMAKEITPDQEIWVMTREGAELTGYSPEYMEQLARKNAKLPEDERLIKVRMRSNRHELWLPDLMRYIEETGYGPHQDKK